MKTLVRTIVVVAALVGAAPSVAQRPAKPKSDSTPKDLPLVSTRTVDIDADDGSWISVDVTPDGRLIVFDFLGDLYSIPFGGGEATPLTSGMAFDGQPRVSPDGKWVTFTSDRDGSENVWILNLETKETRQVTRLKDKAIQSPEWTPDGKYLVATVGDIVFLPGKLWMFHVDGGSGLQLIKQPTTGNPFSGLLTNGAAFGPDPRYLWYSQREGSWQYNAIYPQYQLVVYDRLTGRSDVRTSRFGSAIRPTLSPDGKHLVYGSRYEAQTGLVLRDLASGEEQWLAYPVQRDEQEAIPSRDTYPGMSFTPDSKELVATYGGKIWRIPVDGRPAIPVPFRVKTKIDLGPLVAFKYPLRDSAEFTVRQIRNAVLSPDGRRLAFSALDRLYLADFPRGAPRRLTQADQVETEPTWSPDGQWIAFVTWTRQGGTVSKVRVDGGEPAVVLTEARATYQQPAWSSDGRRIVAIRGPALAWRSEDGPGASGAATDLVAVPAGGGAPTMIAPASGRQRPHFTTDSTRIFLWAGDSGLVSIRWDGTDERRHLKVTGPLLINQEKPAAADLALMAPRGDQALVSAGFDLYLVTVPQVGEPATIALTDPKTAAFPARRLTDIGGEFPSWGADGRTIHWSLGHALAVYHLDSALAVERRIEAEKKRRAALGQDTTKSDSTIGRPYQPVETRIVVRARRDRAEGTAVFRKARVITMRGAEVLDNADVVVRNGRIVSVGPNATAPAGAREIDATGKTIVPGFIDTHAHMWAARGLHKEQPWMYLANLAYGVTTTRDPQTGSTDVFSYEDMVDAGQMIGPRIFSTGPGVGYWLDQLRDLEHAKKVLRRYSTYYDSKYIKMYVKGNRRARQWVAIAAKESGITPTTEGSLDTEFDLTMLIDGYAGQEHATPTVPLYRDVITLYAKSAMTYTPTLLVQYGGPWAEEWYFQREKPYHDPKIRRFMPYEHLAAKTRRRGAGVGPGPGGWFMEDEFIFSQSARIANEIVKAGGRVGVGSHGEFQGLGYHWELWSVASGGMTPHDALRTATILGAEGLGLDGDLGSIEPGKLGDLVVLDRNPLENIRNTNSVRYVMKDGRLYEGDTLDEIWPRQRKLVPPYGLAETPKTAAGLGPPR